MQRSKNDVWVGLFVMLGAVALVFLALQSANLLSFNFQKGYRISARFDNIGGLKPQAAVRSGRYVFVTAGRAAGGGDWWPSRCCMSPITACIICISVCLTRSCRCMPMSCNR